MSINGQSPGQHISLGNDIYQPDFFCWSSIKLVVIYKQVTMNGWWI